MEIIQLFWARVFELLVVYLNEPGWLSVDTQYMDDSNTPRL